MGVDPVVVSAAIVQALQSIVARSMRPTEAGVVTIGSIQGGHIYNVIPETVRMLGTARWFTPSVGEVLEAGVHRLATHVARPSAQRRRWCSAAPTPPPSTTPRRWPVPAAPPPPCRARRG